MPPCLQTLANWSLSSSETVETQTEAALQSESNAFSIVLVSVVRHNFSFSISGLCHNSEVSLELSEQLASVCRQVCIFQGRFEQLQTSAVDQSNCTEISGQPSSPRDSQHPPGSTRRLVTTKNHDLWFPGGHRPVSKTVWVVPKKTRTGTLLHCQIQ